MYPASTEVLISHCRLLCSVAVASIRLESLLANQSKLGRFFGATFYLSGHFADSPVQEDIANHISCLLFP